MAGERVILVAAPFTRMIPGAAAPFSFSAVPEGTYTVQATAPGLRPGTQSIVVSGDLEVDFALDSVADCARVAGNLVVNCGFETGDFTGWTRSGDQGFTSIDTVSAHSGTYGLDTRP